MSTTTYIPDPYLAWLLKWTLRSLVTCIALGVVAFVASIVFRALALLVETLHSALHEVFLFCLSVNQVYLQSGLVGQFLLICLLGGCLLFLIYRGGLFLYQSFCGRIVS